MLNNKECAVLPDVEGYAEISTTFKVKGKFVHNGAMYLEMEGDTPIERVIVLINKCVMPDEG